MGALESLLQYIRQSERLVVVTLTVTVAGLALLAVGQPQLFRGLPEWALPTGIIVWTLCAVHVVIRTVMYLSNRATAAGRFIITIPERRRRAAYNRPLIRRLLATVGVEREILCYALFRERDHIWVPDDRRQPRWLTSLLQKGLVELSDADGRTAHYRIHHIAWAYMQKHPNKFQNLVEWADEPWAIPEDTLEKKIQQAKA